MVKMCKILHKKNTKKSLKIRSKHLVVSSFILFCCLKCLVSSYNVATFSFVTIVSFLFCFWFFFVFLFLPQLDTLVDSFSFCPIEIGFFVWFLCVVSFSHKCYEPKINFLTNTIYHLCHLLSLSRSVIRIFSFLPFLIPILPYT